MKSKRLKFFISHLIISIIITLIIVGLVFIVWYPNPLAQAVGVTHIFLMLIAIDMVVGPLLGLIVYKEGKKSLKFDLTVVILIQISALLYGVFSIAQGRPTWIVYTNKQFELVRNNDVVQDHINLAKPEYQRSSYLKPQLVAVKYATSGVGKSNDVFLEALGGVSLAQFPERYLPINAVIDQIKKQVKDLTLLQQFNNKNEIDTVLLKYPQATAWLPLKANSLDMVVLLDKNAEVVKIVDLHPWK